MAGCMLVVLGGCLPQLVPEPAPPPQRYDFGPPSEDRPAALAQRVRLDTVQAPSWLEGPEIRYRRLDEHPHALRAYARNQWIAAVPELVAQRFRHRLSQAAPGGGAGELVLRLELVRFEQVFTGPDDAYVVLHARARIDGTGAAPRELSYERPAAPNAPGAARALSALVDSAVEDVLEWLRDVSAAGERSAAGRQGRRAAGPGRHRHFSPHSSSSRAWRPQVNL